jgi:hypothetical protein
MSPSSELAPVFPLPTSANTAAMALSPLIFTFCVKVEVHPHLKGPGNEIVNIKFLLDRDPRNPLPRYLHALRISVQGDHA